MSRDRVGFLMMLRMVSIIFHCCLHLRAVFCCGLLVLEKRGCGKSLFMFWEIPAALRLSEAFRTRAGRVVGFFHEVGSESRRLSQGEKRSWICELL